MKFNDNREYEWLIIPQSYFQCALIGARILNKQLSEYAVAEDSHLEYCLREIYGDYKQSPEYLIFPIIFNFKHGIEIYLKSIIGIENSEFPYSHNLIDLLEKSNIDDEKVKCIIRKYAFSNLFFPSNIKCDTENQFERYPQGSPYDSLELFPTINSSGEKIVISQKKIEELIADIEFLHDNIRQMSLHLLKNKKSSIGT